MKMLNFLRKINYYKLAWCLSILAFLGGILCTIHDCLEYSQGLVDFLIGIFFSFILFLIVWVIYYFLIKTLPYIGKCINSEDSFILKVKSLVWLSLLILIWVVLFYIVFFLMLGTDY
ncbi:MAG: hypothetical protein DRP56_04550 [Planctomycetota bacterium]|nr:MAG: hypothetical protein DRP56_04550 [Planctomycetota bacterium]